MYGYQTRDYSADVCEIVKVYKDNGNLEATIYYKPNQVFEVQGACLLREEVGFDWPVGNYKSLHIVTSSGDVVTIRRFSSRGYRNITNGYRLGEVQSVQV